MEEKEKKCPCGQLCPGSSFFIKHSVLPVDDDGVFFLLQLKFLDGCPCDSWDGCAARTDDWKLKSEGQILLLQNNFADPIMVNFDGE